VNAPRFVMTLRDVRARLGKLRCCGHPRIVSTHYDVSPLGVLAEWKCADCDQCWRSVGGGV
jgi:hypothetical protein